MLQDYDTSNILSIIAANKFKVNETNFQLARPVDSVQHLLGEPIEVKYFDLWEDFFLLAFNQDPYEILYETYWSK